MSPKGLRYYALSPPPSRERISSAAADGWTLFVQGYRYRHAWQMYSACRDCVFVYEVIDYISCTRGCIYMIVM